jgi:hypothetical protein
LCRIFVTLEQLEVDHGVNDPAVAVEEGAVGTRAHNKMARFIVEHAVTESGQRVVA